MFSGRLSDIRDVATLLWKRGIPAGLKDRIREGLPYPEVFIDNVKTRLIPAASNPRFIYSWKGTFATKEFNRVTVKSAGTGRSYDVGAVIAPIIPTVYMLLIIVFDMLFLVV